KHLRSSGGRIAEYAVVLFLVLFFYLCVLGFLGIFLPSGLRLQDLMQGKDLTLARRGPAPSAWLTVSPGGDAPSGMRPYVAYLAETRNVVRSRSAGSISWQHAQAGMQLVPRDAVQTADGSGASIRFSPKDWLEMSENSLVIIRKLEQDPVRPAKRSSLIVIDGEFHGRLGGAEKKTFDIELGKSGAGARILAGGAGKGPAEFQVTVNPDRSTTLSMIKGAAEVASKGVTVRVGTNSSTTVSESGSLSPPEGLPAAPVLASPAEDAVFYYRSLPPKVSLGWNALEEADGYRVVVARDPEFRDVLIRKGVSHPSFVHGNLKEGVYYWKVSGKKKWAEGPASKAAQFRIVKDLVPPDLRLETADDGKSRDRCRIKGLTEPGVSVFVSGNPVPLNESGEFECDVRLARGINVIVVEAVDSAGNVAFRSMRKDLIF
ncbi:MAG: hypothetical protein R3239_05655, partial [Thermodesulfobacteriota bacterium]|nr:hypothetical protein [Thermodesulfobacteriota bacterium]